MYTIHRVGSKQIILRSLEAGNTSWALTLVRWRTFAAQTHQPRLGPPRFLIVIRILSFIVFGFKNANHDKESGGTTGTLATNHDLTPPIPYRDSHLFDMFVLQMFSTEPRSGPSLCCQLLGSEE